MNPSIHNSSSQHSEVFAAIAEAIRTVSPRARVATITPSSLLLEELALDSLDLVAVILNLQDQFHVEIDADEISSMRRVQDLGASLANQLCTAA
jgi:acyl carrier protein